MPFTSLPIVNRSWVGILLWAEASQKKSQPKLALVLGGGTI